MESRRQEAILGCGGSVRGSGAGRGAEDGEELLAAVWVGDEGDWLIAEGVEEFVWGEWWWSGEWLGGGEVRLGGGGGNELGDEGGGDGEDGGGGEGVAERLAALGETACGGDEVVGGGGGRGEVGEEIFRVHAVWRRGA
jgi:hypothetical protein